MQWLKPIGFFHSWGLLRAVSFIPIISKKWLTLRKALSPSGTFLVDSTALWYYIVFACQICFCPSGYTLSEEEWTKKFHFFIMILLHLFFASSSPSNARFIQKGTFQFGNILQIYSIVFPKILILNDHNVSGQAPNLFFKEYIYIE